MQINLELGKPDIKRMSVFARHETFHPRFGWLKKGFDLAREDPHIFLRNDAPVLLGVGKNMVRSMRYWCMAFKILQEGEGGCTPTEFGRQLLADDGWDPFLEDPASLWLLHWQLLQPPCQATAWEFAFNAFRQVEFTAEDLFLALCDYREGLAARIADSSLKKDVTCFLRMYAEQEAKGGLTEESIDCPFTVLRLLYEAGDSKRYQFQVGLKENLPAEIVVAACLEFASWMGASQQTISISRLTFAPNSPGLVFKLSEQGIEQAIEQIAYQTKLVDVSESAGLLQLSYTEDPAQLAIELLHQYYQNQAGVVL